MTSTDIIDKPSSKPVQTLERVVIRFAGDSGDGVQTIGDQLGLSSAVAGNDIATLPDFPAEIRAPAGTVYGVSGFQLQFGADATLTAGDEPDVLVAFNPAALKRHLEDLPEGRVLIVDPENFSDRNLKLASYAENPLLDDSLKAWQLHSVPITKLTVETLKALDITGKAAKRCANFFALGLTYWIYSRPLEPTLRFLNDKFKNKPEVIAANTAALKAGYHYGETAEAFQCRYEVPAAENAEPGTYRSVNGNQALAMGLVTAANKANLELFFAGYPITPASDLLHNLASLRALGAKTFQAEDEIAAIGVAIGASYGGALGITASSGPGIALKGEFMGLANAVELPLIVVNVQRGGPSTGLPTKMEQSDLLQALHGRHGESPLPVVAASSPADAFEAGIEAARIAITWRTPVMLLCDGNIAFGTEPWKIPDPDTIPAIDANKQGPTENFRPYSRDDKLARPWAVPGTPGLEHRVGGIEREDGTGNISYDPDNHQYMTDLRAAKVAKVADSYAPLTIDGEQNGKLLVLTWGSPFGPVSTAVRRVHSAGASVGHVHLRNLWPLPNDLGEILGRFERVLVPENNTGQLSTLIRAKYLIDAKGFNQVRGLPFKVSDVEAAILAAVEEQA
ncbi:MAG: 2-oxoacid:acceptor oxidoreductase subunit alpha [Planctomycetota bacterium]|jgi:2-oxoglutarate ferredoxin oxidoreductase subunit alpha|nr:2-oxoacid:acceptor oxidoreductase subunit alpha [Planctomycetota bacterium]